jgi:glucosylglycerate synthase
MPPTSLQDETLTTSGAEPRTEPAKTPLAGILVCLPALPPSALATALDTIAAAFPNEQVLVASPHKNDLDDRTAGPFPNLTIVPYAAERANLGWVLAAADYAAAANLAAERNLPILLLADVPADAPLLRLLATTLRTQKADLVLPRFNLGPSDGLVNTALLYPLSRALFGVDIRFPLPTDAALSPRMAQRLASTTQRLVALNQGSSLLWPVAEAAAANFSVREVDAAEALSPAPPDGDFNALFANVAGSLFSDIETKAAFWQRARTFPARSTETPPPSVEAETVSSEITSIIDNFHLAQDNLQEIWSLVLPPQSRLAFKKLSQLPADAFTLDPALWARTVYDFALAFHLRTLNRNHLLGAMTPLYLAWVGSHLRTVADDPTRAAHAIEQTAAAFETEKPYFVSRWRWPDRFNP